MRFSMTRKISTVLCAMIVSTLCFGSASAKPAEGRGKGKAFSDSCSSCNSDWLLFLRANGVSCSPKTCKPPKPIKKVPITITKSGKYCVDKDLTYTGSGNAITIAASNVTINFNNHSLFLTDPAATGVYAENVEEITLLNDKISCNVISDASTSYAIHFVNVTKANIDNIFTENTLIGVGLDSCLDVAETNSHHKNHIGSDAATGVLGTGSSGISLDNIVFEGNSGVQQFGSAGIAISGGQNSSVTNSKFDELDIGLLTETDGLIIENCLFSSSPTTFYNAIQVGGTGGPANDTIIKNTTVINQNAFVGYDGITCPNGTGLLIENVIVDTNTAFDGSYLPGGIHFGDTSRDPVTSFSNAILKNVIIQNNNDVGLYLNSATNIVFDDGQITGSNDANVLFDLASECTVKNSDISNASGYGLLLNSGASSNAILDNAVNANGNGILVKSGAVGNHIQDNKVFENSVNGIDNQDPSTEFYFNTSCNNGGFNCSAPTGMFPQQAPGATPACAGSNICCPNPI